MRADWRRRVRGLVSQAGTLRVRLTIAVAILSAAGLALGGVLLVNAVETTVVRAIEQRSFTELHEIRGKIAHGVPLTAIRASGPGRRLSFVRPDGSRVEARWPGADEPPPPPCFAPPPCSAPAPCPPPHLASPPSTAPVPVPPLPHLAPPPCSVPVPPPPHLASSACTAPAPSPPPHATSPPPVCPAPPGTASPPRIVMMHDPAGAPPPRLPPPPRLARTPGFGPGGERAVPGEPGLWSVVEMSLQSPQDGPIHAFALSPLEDVLRATETLQQVLVIGIPALIAALTLAAWLLLGRALRPVRVMTQCAAGIADATSPDRVAVPRSHDELGELARTLNGMLDRLAEGARRQREFVSDASHELRSPIAATRALVEVALAHPDRARPETTLRGVLAEATRLEVLVADLLALARLDERQAVLHEELDLDDLVLEDAARARAVAVDTRRVTAVKVHGEPRSLRHVVRNLLDNAARHAVGRVEVSTYLDDDGAPVLVVDDDGPGIPEAERARVFDRFTRLSSSRSRDDGGAGLGLALVRRVAEQHGGSVRADRSPLGGARLEVRFPRALRPIVPTARLR